MSEKMKTIFDLIMRINEETEFAAFVNIQGHVDKLMISVGKDKTKLYSTKVYEVDFYYAGEMKVTERHVQTIINNLKELSEVQ